MTDERNVRARLKRLLSELDMPAQSEIARLFVRHASNLLPTETAGQICGLIDLLDAFAAGKTDRGYAKFSLFNAIVAQQSSYVCRIRDSALQCS